MQRQYTEKQKLEYYKRKAQANQRPQRAMVPYKQRNQRANYGVYNRNKRVLKGAPLNSKPPGMISAGGSTIGGGLGTALGGPAGGAIGSFLGGKLGHLVEKITGFGDYHVNQNTILKGGMNPPQIVNSVEKGGIIVRHREFIRDLPASVAFNNFIFPLNPGQRQTFPWLSQIAAGFEQYRFRGCLFEFISTSSDAVLSAAASTSLGTISIATDYDVLDIPYGDKRTMLNSEYASSNKPSCDFIHPIECKNSLTPMNMQYVRTSFNFPANGDARLYDLGNVIVATEGMQAATGNVGELWVTYEVEFYKPQYLLLANTDHFGLNAPVSTAWFGTAVESSRAVGGSLGGVINGPGTAYSFPPEVSSGQYLFTIHIQGTVGAVIALPTITPTNGGLVDYWHTGVTLVVQAPPAGVTSTSVCVQFIMAVTAPGAFVTIGTALIPTGTVLGDLWVTQIASTITG